MSDPPSRARIPSFTSLHPLVIYNPDTSQMLFLNARRGRQRSEYLCYSCGGQLERQDLGSEQRELLRRVLDIDVADENLEQWAARSQAEEGPAMEAEVPGGRKLGEFELLSTLGHGGMGVVYRAWQPSLGRQVALKCLIRTGDKSEARFAGEIRALGQVTHPHLVKIHTSGPEADQWFYAMELLEGACNCPAFCGPAGSGPSRRSVSVRGRRTLGRSRITNCQWHYGRGALDVDQRHAGSQCLGMPHLGCLPRGP